MNKTQLLELLKNNLPEGINYINSSISNIQNDGTFDLFLQKVGGINTTVTIETNEQKVIENVTSNTQEIVKEAQNIETVQTPTPVQAPINEPVQAQAPINEPVQAQAPINEPVQAQAPINDEEVDNFFI